MATVKLNNFQYIVAPPLVLNEHEEEVLAAILDTFVPRLPQDQEDALVEKFKKIHTEDQVRKFCRASFTSICSTKMVVDMINRSVQPEKRLKFGSLLSMLSIEPGMLRLAGKAVHFKNLTLEEREDIILKWKNSLAPELKAIYSSFRGLALGPFYMTKSEQVLNALKCDINENIVYNEFPEKLPMVQEIEPESHFDVIIIGSGAGGGVMASQLAKSGKSVLVIEKGQYFHESEFTTDDVYRFSNIYEYGGNSVNTDGSVMLMAGSVFGGGTTVNWSASLKPKDFVRKEWADLGLSHFISPQFSKDLETVCDRIGATTDGIVHSGSSKLMAKGCKVLGYNCVDVPQNTSGKHHYCPFCFNGCRAGIKNGTMNTWLRDAHENGAKFLDKTKVKKVLVKNGKAVGVECLMHYEKTIQIKADRVVVSAGSLQSPGILLRSGLKNKNIGQNLRLHPFRMILGRFDENVASHKGNLLTTLCDVAVDIENNGYGSNIEGLSSKPNHIANCIDWNSASSHKEYMLKYSQYSSFLILARDKDSIGSVEYDQNENIITNYKLSDHDSHSIVEGVLRSSDILVAAGAREVLVTQDNVDFFKFEDDEVSDVNNPRFVAWKEKIQKYDGPDNKTRLISVHQMGSNRMGISPEISVVKPTGETWEVQNLYVADSSVFPTASGVNPMVTIEAVALHIAEYITRN